MPNPILVTGATGGQGGAVVDALLARGVPVRALSRSVSSGRADALAEAGAEVVQGSFDDAESLTRAMTGVSAAFALTTPFEQGVDEEVRQGRTILRAALDAQLPHLVFSSVAGADTDSGVPHFESKAVVERELAQSGVPYTILGPTYFYDNALGDADDLEAGRLPLPLPIDRPLQQLARQDLGAFAARVLVDPAPYTGRRIELASDAPTPNEMAAVLTDVLGHDVRAVPVPLRDVRDTDMHAMWSFLNGPGYRVDLDALHREASDVPWTSFREWATATFHRAGHRG
ncbi:NmrA/HSCARG family protein [Rhodococcus sp. HNM0569]|uniref:NmrA/HSCARG family protein n=1 Tax=Rhodococcus sp. HNM0569 TaxID=2716340 RepID=UPI00146DD80B|nr:NmrA/HSCARG family protein [Rhodococcus sp. HNM0569]NLU84320.1 NmrA/HSCARG family protein [Rhodococcus sp. HNM0569]